MPRRVSLPGAAELFRTTPADGHAMGEDHRRARQADDRSADDRTVDAADGTNQPDTAPADDTEVRGADDRGDAPAAGSRSGHGAAAARSPITPEQRGGRRHAGTGRVRHDEKITVYVSSDELLDLERARLSLRAEHRMAVDRGRIVRAALAMALGDLADHGADSELVRRLSQQ